MICEKTPTLSREDYLIRLYEKGFPPVAAFVKKMGGSLEEAKDIFQDALVIYYEKKAAGQLELRNNEQAYVTGIARHLWYKTYHYGKAKVPLNPALEIFFTEAPEPEISKRLLSYVELSGKKCLELLTSFYYDKLNMRELAAKFGFSGERSATAQKFKCIEKVRNAISRRSLRKEDFYE